MRGVTIALAAMMAVAGPDVALAQEWRGIEGVWRIEPGNDLCPAGAAWAYAFSDSGTHLLLWTQGSGLREPIAIPDRFGARPRLQGQGPFYNTRILERRGSMLRNRHSRLTVDGDRLTISDGSLVCRATRVR